MININFFYNTSHFELGELKNTAQRRKRYRAINQQKRNDLFTLLMAKHIFRVLFKDDSAYEIENLNLVDVFVRNPTSNPEGALKSIWDKRLNLNILGSISIKDVKLKDAGKFIKYETDPRVKTLVQYEPEASWEAYLKKEDKNSPTSPCVIERQIDFYEKIRREEILKKV